MNVILSIKPCFCKLIFEGVKRYEYRKRVFKRNDVNKVYVYATITNPGSESVTATVSISGSSSFNSISKTITIGAGASTQIGSYFKIQHTIKNQHVEVRTSKGGYASKTGLTLMGFYD